MSEVRLVDLLAKYQSFTPPEEEVRRVVCESILSVCGFTIPKTSVSVTGEHIYISLSPLRKTRLLLCKENLIQRIQEGLGRIHPPKLL